MDQFVAYINTTTATDWQTTSGHIPQDEHEQEIYNCGEKDFEKVRVFRRE